MDKKKDERILKLKQKAEKLREEVDFLRAEKDEALLRMSLNELFHVEGQRLDGQATRLFVAKLYLDEVITSLEVAEEFDV